ncbi:MAG: SGNH/GDSL hydrolase family protein [Myxococcota bacterium]
MGPTSIARVIRPHLFVATCLMGLLSLLGASSAHAQFSDVYVFGDSLSDTGNGCTVLAIAGYAPGRCSNGDVWSEQFAEMIGNDAEASILGGTNFAFGGDETEDLSIQIFAFALTQLFGQADPNALYVIWLGGNDILGIPSSPTATQDAVDNIIDGIQDLIGMGAQHFLIVNLPDIGRAYGDFELPAGSGSVFTPTERDAVSALSLDFNARLATALAAEPIPTLYTLDIGGLVEEIFANPSAFGLAPEGIDTTSDDTDFAIPCLIDVPCSLDPQGPVSDGFFLFDAIHPTTVAHEVIAIRAAVAVPEPVRWATVASGALVVGLLARRRTRAAKRR